MIDLSNNNAAGHHFSQVVRSGHQHRVYLKRTEDKSFVDRTFSTLRANAHKAGMRVGGYHFAHPLEVTPHESFLFFTKQEPKYVRGKDLRDCLDLEHGTPSRKVGRWTEEWVKLHKDAYGFFPVLYCGAYYAGPCEFERWMGRVPLWVPAYGRNDGKEYPYVIPKPWKVAAAHQYASCERLPGISGQCDISHVFNGKALDVPGPVRRLVLRGG